MKDVHLQPIPVNLTLTIAGIGPRGGLQRENLLLALERLRAMGVSVWAAIHCPELGCGLDGNGNYYEQPSLRLPEGFIPALLPLFPHRWKPRAGGGTPPPCRRQGVTLPA